MKSLSQNQSHFLLIRGTDRQVLRVQFFLILKNTFKEKDVENKEIMLIGDFNCDWDPEKGRISWQKDYLKSIAITYQFKQLITGHTRITDS